jgi:hypothetical protein
MNAKDISIINPEVEARLKKWKVKIRSGPQSVTHSTYGTETILSPEQFAIYEGALKAIYTHWFIETMPGGGMQGNVLGVIAYHRSIADLNDISLPYIPNKYFRGRQSVVNELGKEYSAEAARDYHFFAAILREETGTNAKTGEAENLYYATLD